MNIYMIGNLYLLYLCIGDGGLDKKEIAYLKGMIFLRYDIT